MTLRDEVWDAVIKQLIKRGEFKISHLPFSESELHTTRRTLREMELMEWVERENRRPSVWSPGDVAKECLNVEADS